MFDSKRKLYKEKMIKNLSESESFIVFADNTIAIQGSILDIQTLLTFGIRALLDDCKKKEDRKLIEKSIEYAFMEESKLKEEAINMLNRVKKIIENN